jgi:site-specific DNA-cytosine methylase
LSRSRGPARRRYTILHLFGGSGGGGYGSKKAVATLGLQEASFDVLGSVDIDRQACRDFEMLVGAPTLCGDIATMQPGELRQEFGQASPDMVLLSPPCVGFSALLPKKRAELEHYQALNRLVLQGVNLVLTTWTPRVIFLENVPRILSRGAELLMQVRQVLMAHGYAWAEGIHDCGEVGGLGQHRRRYFLVARHRASMSQFVYVPPKQPLLSCGDVLRLLPVPALSEGGGPMHTLPKISFLNQARLAMIPPGGDWRDLPGVLPEGSPRRSKHRRHLVVDWHVPAPTIGGSGSNGATAVADPLGYRGYLGVLNADEPAGTVTAGAAVARGAFAIAENRLALGRTAQGSQNFKGSPGLFGVQPWEEPAKAVTGNATVSGSNTPGAVADPRAFKGGYGVLDWQETAGTVSAEAYPSTGRFTVSDPRAFHGSYGVLDWENPAGTVSAGAGCSTGTFSVADPRVDDVMAALEQDEPAAATPSPISNPRCGEYWCNYRVLRWDQTAKTVASASRPGSGAQAVADLRIDLDEIVPNRPQWAGTYGVLHWSEAADVIAGNLRHDNGRGSVADPRLARVLAMLPANPARRPRGTVLIISPDGTWHRPLTTLELAALQGFPVELGGRPLIFDGKSHSRWRQTIGNAIPPPSAEKVCEQILEALVASDDDTFRLSSNEIWVRQQEEGAVVV